MKLIGDTSCERVDKYISLNSCLSRNKVLEMIDKELVLVNGKVVKKSYKVEENDDIFVPDDYFKEITLEKEDIPLDILYEDDYILVVNKPSGMVVHPGNGNSNHTLVNALLNHTDKLAQKNIRPGIVHRIDKNTSGLLIVAKNDAAHRKIAEQIKEHSFTREYEAVVCGNIKENEGTVNQPIGRNPNDRKKMAVTAVNSKEAVTYFRVLQRFGQYTHISVTLETGRTHQIRVHMAYIHHPVAGDDVYGSDKLTEKLCGQCLHARKIGFVHPSTGEYMEFTSELPKYFSDFLQELSKRYL